MQRAFYTRYKKSHGLKFQFVSLPNGMDFHVFGPVSARRHDVFILGESNINEHLGHLQGDQPENHHYRIYADSGYEYAGRSHILTRHRPFGITPAEEVENRVMKACRESIEWNFGEIIRLWAFIDWTKEMKLMKMPVADLDVVAIVLRNAYNCLNHGETSAYFECSPPAIHNWLRQGPRDAL